MRRILIFSCMFFILLTANKVKAQEKVKEKEDKTKMKDDNSKEKDKDGKVKMKDDNMKMKMKAQDGMITYPYTAAYSSNFVIGNPAHAQVVLNAWKDWDDNMLDRHDFVADTITFYTSAGMVLKGREATMNSIKKGRTELTGSKTTVDAWIPLRSVDRKEDWVAIWGTETDITPDGKSDTYNIHEVWRINKDGKVDLVRQFTSKVSQQ